MRPSLTRINCSVIYRCCSRCASYATPVRAWAFSGVATRAARADGDAVAVIYVNCAELLSLLLAAEAVAIYAPINSGLPIEHATELVRAQGARVLVASGLELDAGAWARAREIAGARALVAMRPTATPRIPTAGFLDGGVSTWRESCCTPMRRESARSNVMDVHR